MPQGPPRAVLDSGVFVAGWSRRVLQRLASSEPPLRAGLVGVEHRRDLARPALARLNGGRVDRDVRAFFDQLAEAGPELGNNVRAYLALTALLQATPLRVDTLAEQAQCTRDEALQTLEQLRAAGAVQSLVHRGSSYRLTPRARDQLRTRLRYGTSRPLDAHWDMIRAYLDTVPEIGRADVVALLGITPVQASRILSQLFRDRGVIEPVSNVRGRGVRYRAPRNMRT